MVKKNHGITKINTTLQKTYQHVHPPSFILKKENLKNGMYFLEVFGNNKKIGTVKFEVY